MTIRHDKHVIPPNNFTLIAIGDPGSTIALPEDCRGLLIGTAGALNVTMVNGEQKANLPMIEGVNPGRFSEVRLTVAGAANIWAIT